MLKRKIKIILIGLSSLLFVGLLYILFSPKPEIIADESLRIEEPEIPGLKAQVDRAVNANDGQLSIASDSQIESSLEAQLIDQPVASYRDEIISSQGPQSNQLDQAPTELVETPDAEVVESTGLSNEMPVMSESSVENNQSEAVIDQSVSPFRDDGMNKRSEADIKTEASGVAISPDASGFIDLNLSETELKDEEKALTKKDQLIVDEINKALGELRLVDSEKPKDEINKNNAGQDSVKTKPAFPDVEAVETDSSSPEATADVEKEVVNTENLAVAKLNTSKPSVFTLPEIDQEMMRGSNKISKKYRDTMAKLISINAKLRDANNENIELQARFDMTVSQNRQLAQIIRDIDTQIKAFTLTN